jgi:hydroxymethylglutaryl-CoA synthase
MKRGDMDIGIEKINFYTGSLLIDIERLAKSRNRDAKFFKEDLMIDKKSQNVDYEDVITMAVNAAIPIISDDDRDKIELCVFATESGTDFCKPNSTYICKYLGLKSEVRNFEIKNACYAATCGIQIAINWIASGVSPGKKALVISSDINYDHEGRSGEEVPGVGAVAILVSSDPKIIKYEIGKNGYFTFECTDYARPTPTYDIINAQESLYAYLDCLEGAYLHYLTKTGTIDFNSYFKRVIYHTPFGGLVKMAHGRLLKMMYPGIKKSEISDNFNEKVASSFKIPLYVGNTYSSTVYTCLLGLLNDDDGILPGDRIGIYSYGSGSCAEFYSAIVMPGAKDIIRSLDIDGHLASRYELSIAEFDDLSKKRSSHAEQKSYITDHDIPKGWHDKYYKDKKLLVFKGVKEYIRIYEWS